MEVQYVHIEIVLLTSSATAADVLTYSSCLCANSGEFLLQAGIRVRQTVDTGCPRRNVPDFGRVLLMLKYTDITQNTYIQS
jgi:hypothetical protein